MKFSTCPNCGYSVKWPHYPWPHIVGHFQPSKCWKCGFILTNLISGVHAGVWDVVYVGYDERKKAYVKSTSNQWKRGKVVNVEWMHLTFGRWINIGCIKICFDDGTVERIRANLVKVYSEPFDPSKRPKDALPIRPDARRHK